MPDGADPVVPGIELPDVAPAASADDAWVPQFAFEPLAGVSGAPDADEAVQESPTEAAESRPADAVAEAEPVPPATEAVPVSEGEHVSLAGPAPVSEPAPAVAGASFDQIAFGQAEPAPAVEPASAPVAAPAQVETVQEEASAQEKIPEALTLEALPKFEELLAASRRPSRARRCPAQTRPLRAPSADEPGARAHPCDPEPQVFLAGPLEAAPAPLAPAHGPRRRAPGSAEPDDSSPSRAGRSSVAPAR